MHTDNNPARPLEDYVRIVVNNEEETTGETEKHYLPNSTEAYKQRLYRLQHPRPPRPKELIQEVSITRGMTRQQRAKLLKQKQKKK